MAGKVSSGEGARMWNAGAEEATLVSNRQGESMGGRNQRALQERSLHSPSVAINEAPLQRH